MEDLHNVYCGASGFSYSHVTSLAGLFSLTHPSSCTNHLLVTTFDVLLLVMFLFTILFKTPLKPSQMAASACNISGLQLVSYIYNGLLGLVYLSSGIWCFEESLRKTRVVVPLHWWMMFIIHGLTWLLLGLTVSLKGQQFSRAPLRLLSVVTFLFAGIICSLSILSATLRKEVSFKIVLDILCFAGSCLLMLCTYKVYRYGSEDNVIYDPLLTDANGRQTSNSAQAVTPFATASFLSRSMFSWLSPLMKRGREKILEDEDIPQLGKGDQARSCYLLYTEIFNRNEQSDPSCRPSVLRTILVCHWKEIFVSGLFAILKIVTLSMGPLLVKSFIEVMEGKQSFRHERFILVATLFFTKILESISQRQWFFRARLIGLKVRSLLTAAIYEKQLRLSNASKQVHSSGEIMNYATVDAYRIGEFPYWFHQIWTTILQLCLSILILFQAVGIATVASLVVIVLAVVCNTPIARMQHRFLSELMVAQDGRLRTMTEALMNMKVLKLYAWEKRFGLVIDNLRTIEHKWLTAVQRYRAYNIFLFWVSPVLVSGATFCTCYIVGVELSSSNVFTFIATLNLVQEPVRVIPDVIAAFIQANVSFTRIVEFLQAPELKTANGEKSHVDDTHCSVSFKLADLSWKENPSRPTLKSISFAMEPGSKIAICGEVGSGKSTLLAAVLGEVPVTYGTVKVQGSLAYVSQSAWIQSGSIRENILFGSVMDDKRYQDALERCSLVKDLELLPYGDLTEIGERGINLSGGQKQRVQLARALYKDADIYLLDDPFSAVDAHTATSLFNEYVMGALSGKTVLLVTHQVEFLPELDSVLLLSDGKILHAAPYSEMLASSQEFRDLVNAHRKTAGVGIPSKLTSSVRHEIKSTSQEIFRTYPVNEAGTSQRDQLIKKEEREVGDTGFKPYILYLCHKRGFLIFSLACLTHLVVVLGLIVQSSWMAANVDDESVSRFNLILVYLIIGVVCALLTGIRTIFNIALGLQASKAMFSKLLLSLFRAPMSFYDSTPLGRILSRVSSDLSIVDLELPLNLTYAVAQTIIAYCYIVVLAVITWQVLFVAVPMVLVAIRLQAYYFSSAKELMRINGTTKSSIANHLAESLAGVVTIRAFKEEDRFFAKNLELIDTNSSPFFHYFSANEWLILRLEALTAVILAFASLCMVLVPQGTLSPGFIGMALSYGLSLNVALRISIDFQCRLANNIISVERLEQYMHIPSEAPEVIEENRTPIDWPNEGRVDFHDLKIRYRPDAPLVLHGISCTFEGGHKIGIVGRTGSGKTTLIGALFRLVEPAGGKIVVDGIDISMIGLHDLRSHFGIIPQDPTLFAGTVRYNLDPLGQHTDQELWEVLAKCQLRDTVQEKLGGLDSAVLEDGSNWSMGQRQLFCLGRALLRKSKVLVLDEATASIDNATDMILQKTIRIEFADCTVITVAHRIPTVMDCNMVLGISNGELVEYDEPMKLMKQEDSLFGQLVKEYWSHQQLA